MRNQSLLRVLRLADYLRHHRASVRQLASEFSVTTRTIRRDLILLQEVPLPVTKIDGERTAHEPSLWWIAR